MALVLQAVGWPSVGLVKTSVGIWVPNTTSHPSPGVLKPNISQPQAVQVCHPPHRPYGCLSASLSQILAHCIILHLRNAGFICHSVQDQIIF